VVADGMGGHSHGEIASRIAVDAIREFVAKTSDDDATLPFDVDPRLSRNSNRLRAAIRVAHDKVLKAIRNDASLHGMGTTVVGLLVDGESASIAHVGDSRCYRLRDGRLERMSKDQTIAQELVETGALTETEAHRSPFRSVLASALGGREALPQTTATDCRWDDVLLVCSDGLTRHVSDAELEAELRQVRSSEESCRRLVALALERGGEDNVTVIISRLKPRVAS
jgi:protein phosphatase